jgi:hypothetical protein
MHGAGKACWGRVRSAALPRSYVNVSPVENSRRLEFYYGAAQQILSQAKELHAANDLDKVRHPYSLASATPHPTTRYCLQE